MKHFPAARPYARIEGISHTRAPALPARSRAFWFTLGFFAALNVAGVVAGLLPFPQ